MAVQMNLFTVQMEKRYVNYVDNRSVLHRATGGYEGKSVFCIEQPLQHTDYK